MQYVLRQLCRYGMLTHGHNHRQSIVMLMTRRHLNYRQAKHLQAVCLVSAIYLDSNERSWLFNLDIQSAWQETPCLETTEQQAVVWYSWLCCEVLIIIVNKQEAGSQIT